MLAPASRGSLPASGVQEGARAVPVAPLEAVDDALVDHQLAVLGDADAKALQRSWRRAFEVDAGLAEPAAVAGALELLFDLQPARRAAEVGALGEQRIEP